MTRSNVGDLSVVCDAHSGLPETFDVEVVGRASPAAGPGTFFCRGVQRRTARSKNNGAGHCRPGPQALLCLKRSVLVVRISMELTLAIGANSCLWLDNLDIMLARSFASRAFSQQCPRNVRPGIRLPCPTWRYFSSSIARTKAQQPSKVAKPPTPEETLKFAGRRPEGFGKLERKAAKEGNLVLFKSPSHRSYIIGAYSLAAFCFGYTVYNSNIVFRDPIRPVPMWYQGLFGGICVVMSVMGTVFLSKTGRLVKSVNAIYSNGRTRLRFSIRSMIPFRKPYEFDALPRQIAFSRRLVVSPEFLKRTQQPEAAQGAKPSSEWEVMKAPAKKISVTLWKIFTNIRKLFTQEDFILLEVEGQQGVFRMDSSGYVSEDFLAVGNPVSLKR